MSLTPIAMLGSTRLVSLQADILVMPFDKLRLLPAEKKRKISFIRVE